jgi:HAE1 family hydrophobic/amphiphilic exporter-1
MNGEHVQKTEEFKKRYEEKMQKAVKETRKSLPGFFITNFRFTYLILIGILITGIYSMLTLPREAEPEIRVPFASVVTVYPGANPLDVEELVTDKIEAEIKNLDNIKVFNSSSGQGFSSIFVEYEAEADLQESFRKLREAVDNSEKNLPEDAETPTVTEINFSDFPIVTYSLVGEGFDDVSLKKIADELQAELENVRDVSKVEIIGGIEREFQVFISQTKLANFNISLSQITQAISTSNFSLPSGDIEIDNFIYNVRVKGRFQSAEELNDIVVATYNDSPVFLRDIATIKDDYKEKKSESKIGFQNEPARNTVSLQVFKKTGGNILNIVKNSQEKIADLYEKNVLPENLTIQKTNDNSVFIKEDLRTLGQSGIQTVILITLILMLILSFRGSIITALSVPIAFLMAFIFLGIQGLTLNSMVLFSLVLSLGLMVDNSIIIIEGINEYVEYHKKSVYEGALLSVWNFKWAIIAGTMTTVAAFLPMLLVSGILGEYISILPKTISVTLLSSLFVALIVIPTIVTRFIKVDHSKKQKQRDKKRHVFIAKKMQKLYRFYGPLMRKVLVSKKKRRLSLATAFILFVTAVAVPATGLMEIEMFPSVDLDYFLINAKLPVGSTLDSTRPVADEIEKIVKEIPEMDNYVINLGSSASLDSGGGGSSGENLANITVNLVDKKDRERLSYEITEEVRNKLLLIQGAELTVEELSAGPPTGAPIEVRINGDDLTELAQVTKDIKAVIASIDGTINIKDNFQDAAGEFTFTVDKQKANYYGLNMITIASTLRNALFGSTASEVNVDGEDVDITVKYKENEFTTVNDLENIIIFTPNGQSITLKQVASVDFNPALLSIRHRDGDLSASVTADIENNVVLKNVLDEFEEKKNALALPDGFQITVGGEVEDIEKSFRETFLSLGLAVVLIAFILVLQFNSFKQPFIILFALPLSIIGVIAGLNLVGQPFSFLAFIGIVSLSGIVVNDAIVLIDRINKNINNGLEFIDSIVEAGIARMQPIFLTSITTIAGVFPLIYANEVWRGFSFTVIFGLMASTVLILYIIPIIYAGMCQGEKCFKPER